MRRSALLAACSFALACSTPPERPPPPPNDGIHGFAGGCYAIDASEPGGAHAQYLAATATGEAYAFSTYDAAEAAHFSMRAADLGTYLFYDREQHYLVAEDGPLLRQRELLSDILTVDDAYVSGAEWELEVSLHDADRFQLRHRRSGRWLGTGGLVDDAARAAVLAFYPVEGCAEFPELTLDAEGEVWRTTFADGDLFGIVDTHSHLFTNLGFGGGGIFHGAPFHRLGVEHALPDCSLFHGGEGRRDLLGFGYDQGRTVDSDLLLTTFLTGRTPEFNHHTAGYPDFTDWPSGHDSSTHQTQYYRWIQRAWLGGLRLIVQHATTNRVLCEMFVGQNIQEVRYSCSDMFAVDREIEETYALERYIDAQHGGPGRGWLRVVTSPAQAREVIAAGQLAVILGIETSNLFECLLTPPPGVPRCDEARVIEQLDRYHALGVRVLFPVHKYDNAFSAGDGDRAIVEIGNFINSGHWSNFTEDCPAINTVFDDGDLVFGGLNMARTVYDAPAPVDFSDFARSPSAAMVPHLDALMGPSLTGDYCQNAGLTPLGEFLIAEMMRRGMILEVDHFPRRAYQRVFEILEAADYPAAGTHGLNNGGRIYAIGGISEGSLGRCRDPSTPGTMTDRLRSRVALITANGGYPAEGFGFDLNGFAGAPGPRFGPGTVCGATPQDEPVTYPFTSYGGDVTFTEPRVGNRTLDFNAEGMAHLGLMPELIDDARRDAGDDTALEPLFRSAEGYVRMWERAEARAAAMP